MGIEMKSFILIILIIAFLIIGCSGETENGGLVKQEEFVGKGTTVRNEVVSMKLISPAFANNGRIPPEYTCDGSGTSPELNIADVPKNAKSLVLINDDPDAPVGVWDHWIVFNIPATTAKISKGEEPNGAGGRNSWGRTGYGGPCPPSGVHRYFFKLYALDALLNLKEGADKKQIEAAMQGHILAQAELMGTYKRQ